jgi:Flp pilus assembly protein TadD
VISRRDFALAALLAFTTACVFAPALRLEFVLYDDPEYVTDNPMVRTGLSAGGVRWAFTTFHAANWHPLTWLSHMLDATVFGRAAWGHHLSSVLLHAVTTALCFLVLVGWTGAPGRSALAAMLFAVHPLRVESVAWVAERKDVLAGFWWMLALVAYGAWVRRRTALRYGAVVVAFACGLLSKPMVVTLPFVLLLLDLWPLCRPITARLVVEKVPLFALAAASSAVTFAAQRAGGAVMPLEHLSAVERVTGAVVAYTMYLANTVWPVNLAVFYPIRPLGLVDVAAAAAVLGGLSVLVLAPAGRAPAPAIGWLWFLGTLVPVIGLVKVGQQASADRFTYLPHVGLFVALVWWLGDRLSSRLGAALGGIAVVMLSALTIRQFGVWQDSVALFTHALGVAGDNAVAEANLAGALVQEGQLDAARPHAEPAALLAPAAPEAQLVLGLVRLHSGDLVAAETGFREAARLDPRDARAHYNLGVVATRRGELEDAVAHYRRAITERPTYVGAHVNLGVLLTESGRLEEAEDALRQATHLDPASSAAFANLALVFERRVRPTEAIVAYRAALALAPGEPTLWFNLAATLAGAGEREQAVAAMREALRLRPGWEPARHALAELGAQ